MNGARVIPCTAASGKRLIRCVDGDQDRTDGGYGDASRRNALKSHAIDPIVTEHLTTTIGARAATSTKCRSVTTVTILKAAAIGIEIGIDLGPHPLIGGDIGGDRDKHGGDPREDRQRDRDANAKSHGVRRV
jgi:hypothetical protein